MSSKYRMNHLMSLILVCFSVLIAVARGQTERPPYNAAFDLYHLFDRSNSMGKIMYGRHVEFGKNLSMLYGNATGYYDELDNGFGIRVTVVGFGCRGHSNDKSKIFLDQGATSANVTAGFQLAAAASPNRRTTCLIPAMNIVSERVNATALEDPDRKSVIIVYTDAESGDFGSDQIRNNPMFENPNVKIYGVGIGPSTKFPRLGMVAGSTNRTFHGPSAKNLTSLYEASLPFITQSFIYSIVDRASKQRLQEPCLGSELAVEVSSNRLLGMDDENESFECHFMPGDSKFTTVPLYSSQGKYYCDLPSSFSSTLSEDFLLELWTSTDDGEELEGSANVQFQQTACMDFKVENASSACVGDNVKVTISGETVESLKNSNDLELVCSFGSNGTDETIVSVVELIDGSVSCVSNGNVVLASAKNNASLVEAESEIVAQNGFLVVNTLSVFVRSQSDQSEFLLANTNDLVLEPQFCADVPANVTFCLGNEQNNNFEFTGDSVDFFKLRIDSAHDHSFACLISSNENRSITKATVTSTGIACVLTEDLSISLIEGIDELSVELSLVSETEKEVFLLSEKIRFDVRSNFCIDYQTRSSSTDTFTPIGSLSHDFDICWGLDGSEMAVRLSGASEEYVISHNVSCAFSLESDSPYSESPVEVMSGGEIVCALPESFSKLEDANESVIYMQILSKTGGESHKLDMKVMTLNVGVNEPCLVPTVLSKTVPEIADSNTICFATEAFLEISGKSVPHLTRDIEDLKCMFSGVDNQENAILTVATLSVDGNILCDMPEDSTTRNGTFKSVSLVQGDQNVAIVNTKIVPYTVSTTEDNCTTTTSAVANENDLCAGDTVKTTFSGVSIKSLLQLQADTEAECLFQKANGTVDSTTASIDNEAGEIICIMPVWSPFSEENRTNLDYTTLSLRFPGLDEVLTVPLPSVPFCMDVSSHGVSADKAPSRALASTIVTDPEYVDCWPQCCKRATVSIEFSGRTLQVLEKHPERVRCAFHSVQSESPEVVYSNISLTAQAGQINGLVCDAVPGWRPDGSSHGNFDSVTIEILESNFGDSEYIMNEQVYSPSSGNHSCVNVYSAAAQEFGPVEIFAEGLTIEAVIDYLQDQGRTVEESINCTVFSQDDTSGVVFKVQEGDSSGLSCVRNFESPFVFTSPSLALLVDESGSATTLVANEFQEIIQIDDASNLPRKPPTDSNENLGLILGWVFGLLILMMLCCVAVFCVYKKKRENETIEKKLEEGSSPEDNTPDDGPFDFIPLSGGSNADAAIFIVGARIEALDTSIGDIEKSNWYKGTILELLEPGLFEIEFDHESELGRKQVLEKSLRIPLNDFGIDEVVDARKSNNTWHRATVTRREKNNNYTIKWCQGDEEMILVDGNSVRPPKTLFKLNDLVTAKGGNYRREIGVVTGVNADETSDKDTFDVKYYSPSVGTRTGVVAENLLIFDLVPGVVVEMKDDEDTNVWHQVHLVNYKKEQQVCDVQKDNTRINDVPVTCLSRVHYEIGAPVDILVIPDEEHVASVMNQNAFSPSSKIVKSSAVSNGYENERTEWLPGRVVRANSDGVSFEVEFEHSSKPNEKNAIVNRLRKRQIFVHSEMDPEPEPESKVSRPMLRSVGGGFKRKTPLKFKELPEDRYEITVNKKQGLGISLGLTTENEIIVARFLDLANKDWGPLEASGLVGLKDQLLTINGVRIDGFSFAKASEFIRISPDEISLGFGRWHGDNES